MTDEPREDDYVPIDCDRHSALELLALRRADVHIAVREAADGASASHSGRIVDVVTRDGAEYLIVEQPPRQLALRLDHLREIRAPGGERLYP